MKIKSKIMHGFFAILMVCQAGFSMESTSQNIAVFGGGGVNAYAALVMAAKFAEMCDKPFKNLFHQAWGISGGTIPATMLMAGKNTDAEIAEIFQSTVGTASPDIGDIARDPMDTNGARRAKFEQGLVPHLGGLKFGESKNNRFVYIACAEGKPVYFCDTDMPLGSTELRCQKDTACIKGIIDSSCYDSSRCDSCCCDSCCHSKASFIPFNLFKKESLTLSPGGIVQEICDGGLCYSKIGDRFILDGFTPTPLVIEHLLTIPGNHNVVIFDNGGPENEKFRDWINVDERGIAIVEHGDVIINVFIISVDVESFMKRSVNKTPENLSYLVDQVNEAIGGISGDVFEQAMKAVTTNSIELN